MLRPSRQHSMLPSPRSTLPRLLVVAASLALGACDGANDPLAPAGEDVLAPASEPVASNAALAVVTSQLIVFSSGRNDFQSDIYKMDPQGHNVTRLTYTTDSETAPAVSWDNKHIAMVRVRRDASNIQHDDIYVINTDGSNGHWARSAPYGYNLGDPSWSPDGSHLVLAVNVGGTQYLGLLHLDTGTIDAVAEGTGGVKGYQPSYDRTGQRIVYLGNGGNTVEQVNADGSGHKTRYSTPATVPVRNPTFSPDGKKIAFDRIVGTGNNVEIFVKNLLDGSVKRLTSSAGADLQPSWSPDGSRIAFASVRSGKFKIWTMSATTGGNLVRISNAAGDWEPEWSH
jgi:Tol biopolymer transport system component